MAKWQSGKNGENLTCKVRMTEMTKDHKTFDEYVMGAQWDIPDQMSIGKNGQYLTEKLKKADMVKDHKKIDWNLIATLWDVPGQRVNLTKMTNPAETERTCQEGEKLWIWQEKSPKGWCKLKWGSKRFFGKIANLVKYAKSWPKWWKWEIWPKNYQIAGIE